MHNEMGLQIIACKTYTSDAKRLGSSSVAMVNPVALVDPVAMVDPIAMVGPVAMVEEPRLGSGKGFWP